MLGGAEAVERELKVHVDPEAGDATRGTISLVFKAASGLQTSYTRGVSLALVNAFDATGPFPPDNDFPLERCSAGCDLTYLIRIVSRPDVLPGSVVRYEVDVRLEYDHNSRSHTESELRLDLEGQASGPVAPVWSLLAGVLALVGGIAAGPRVHAALGTRRRRLPALALIAAAIGSIVWGVILWAGYISGSEVRLSPGLLLAVLDPWSTALVGTLAWEIWQGLRRWDADGGWMLGLAAVATVGLGGLWMAWWSTVDALVQPVLLALPFVVLGLLGGVVIGQAWRTDARARHDRWWAALAVLSHGVLIAGFGFLAQQGAFDPFSGPQPTSLLLLVPAVLVVLAFRRWLGGRQGWLVLFDLAIALIGLLGLMFWTSAFPFAANPHRFEIDDVGVFLAVTSAVVAFVTSLHSMRRTTPAGTSVAPDDTIGRLTEVMARSRAVDDPPTT